MPAPHICVNDLPASQSGNREGDRVAKSAGAFPGFCRDLKPQHRRLHEPGGTLDVDSLADLACGPCVLQSFNQRLVQQAAAFDAKRGQLRVGASKFTDGTDTHAALFARGPIRGSHADKQSFDSGEGRRDRSEPLNVPGNALQLISLERFNIEAPFIGTRTPVACQTAFRRAGTMSGSSSQRNSISSSISTPRK